LSSYLPDFFFVQDIEILPTLTLGVLEKKRRNKHTRNLEKSKRKGKWKSKEEELPTKRSKATNACIACCSRTPLTTCGRVTKLRCSSSCTECKRKRSGAAAIIIIIIM
jgi:hypothetical protein